MSGWNEDDFLEAMMPVLRKTKGPDWCPDVETLGAVVEGNLSDALKEAIASHTASCPVCAGLYERAPQLRSGEPNLRPTGSGVGERQKKLA